MDKETQTKKVTTTTCVDCCVSEEASTSKVALGLNVELFLTLLFSFFLFWRRGKKNCSFENRLKHAPSMTPNICTCEYPLRQEKRQSSLNHLFLELDRDHVTSIIFFLLRIRNDV